MKSSIIGGLVSTSTQRKFRLRAEFFCAFLITKALRIPWDIEEAVLMLDMLLKSIDGKLTRKEAIHQVSEKLRRRAVNRGIEIDEIFRNENGIT